MVPIVLSRRLTPEKVGRTWAAGLSLGMDMTGSKQNPWEIKKEIVLLMVKLL